VSYGVTMHKSVMLLLVLVIVTLACSQFLPVNANPFTLPTVPAPAGVHLIFDMESPVENATYPNGAVAVIFNVTVDGPSRINGQPLNKVLTVTTYQGDWMQESKWCRPSSIFYTLPFYGFNFSITGIPFGQHTVNFTGHAQGDFVLANGSGCEYFLEKTVSLTFFVLANPVIEFSSPQNANSTTSSFPLNFTVDHAVTEIAYILDGQESIPISGNTTLTDLPNGRHNVTVYATDEFGYTGESNTLFFNVNSPESFPVVPVIAVSAVAVVVGAGLLVYFKKGKRKTANLSK